MHLEQNTYSLFTWFLLTKDNRLLHDLLDTWVARITVENKYDFENGIIGLGWLIAFLIRNDYLNGDIDEILEEVDDNIYKFTIGTIVEEPLDINKLLKLVVYYHQRHENKGPATQYNRQFVFSECLKLLIEKLNFFLLEDSEDECILMLKTDVLLKYSYLIRSGIEEKFVEEAFYVGIETLIARFEDFDIRNILNENLIIGLLKLLVCAKQYQNPFWIKKLHSIYIDSRIKADDHIKSGIPFNVWDKIQSMYPESQLNYRDYYRGHWETKEGQELLFILYTNLRSFAIK